MSTRTKEKWSAAFVGGGLLLGVFALWLGLRHVFDNWTGPLITAVPGSHNRPEPVASAPSVYVQVAIALFVIACIVVVAGLVVAGIAYAKKRPTERLGGFTIAMLAGVATIVLSIVLSSFLFDAPQGDGIHSDFSVNVMIVGTLLGAALTVVGSVGALVRPSTSAVDGLVAVPD